MNYADFTDEAAIRQPHKIDIALAIRVLQRRGEVVERSQAKGLKVNVIGRKERS